ncbi:TetR/AcrR family transcriptional regulator [Microbispora triticiradicis]|uniref:TetR/AcrR family transcriptional regulator n=3 Tax=Microbispora TaxID=2005 RepID=A0ABY3LVV6_9ACTN|nr:TetR/AcrR family transcriptional regulator [Microbispora triticiradicis]TLP59583.1 TetR/AcrR family transcriptional regulator [Microbispora fusca]TYB56667.1 TetR/AcrR family transcriptional regulator [Microbispora tritici]
MWGVSAPAGKQPYHHGDLRRVLMDVTLEAIAEDGLGELSLRELARRANVSHAAPAHHFRSRAGLLTAIAAEGYNLLADQLERVRGDDLTERAVAYLRFATKHPAHFAVMRAPELCIDRDPELLVARERAGEQLLRPADRTAALAAWALAHGLANLLLEGNVHPDPGGDVESLARTLLHHLT